MKNIGSVPYVVQCLLVAYFIHNTLYLLLPYPYLVPPHFPLPSGNHIASLYLSLLLFCYVSLFVAMTSVFSWQNSISLCPASFHIPRPNTLFQQHKIRLYTWTSPDGQYQNQIDCIFYSQGWRNSTESAKTRPGADCGTDHELLIAKFRLKLRKVGKTTTPFKYHLNQIPHYYTVELTNRLKGLDLVVRVPEGLWAGVHDIVQEQ